MRTHAPVRTPRRSRAATRRRSRLRHDGRRSRRPSTRTSTTARTYYFCNPRCRDEVHRRSGALPRSRRAMTRRAAEAEPRGHDLHLPDASRDRRRSARAPARSAAWRSSRWACRRRTTGPNPELVDFTRRSEDRRRADGAAARPGHGADRRPAASTAGSAPQAAGWIELVLATPVVVWCGWPFFERGWASIVNRSPNMWTLISHRRRRGLCLQRRRRAGAGHLPARLPHARRRRRPSTSRPPPSSSCWCCWARCWSCGRASSTGNAIRALLDLAPKTARRIAADGSETEVPLETVVSRRPAARAPRRDRSRRRRGRRGPLRASTRSLLTGEPMPVEKTGGRRRDRRHAQHDRHASSCEARKVGAETMLARIVAMVAEAQRSRAPIQGLADAVAAWFVPAVVLIAVLAFVAWLVVGPEPVARLRASSPPSPCSSSPARARSGLATPMSIMVATGRGARAGRADPQRRGAGAAGRGRHARSSTRPAR